MSSKNGQVKDLGTPDATSENPRMQAALDYASRGWRVFPLHWVADGKCSCREEDCDKKGKHPFGKLVHHGCKDATTDAKTIQRWWTRYPSCNVAIATGRESRLFVVDADGAQGLQDLAELQEQYGPLPPTVRCRTGGGGEQLYFRWPEGGTIHCYTRHREKKIDLRGEGGVAIPPPAQHKSGRAYAWIDAPDRVPVAEAPSWLLEWCEKEKRHGQPPPSAPQQGGAVRAVRNLTVEIEQARLYLRTCEPGIKGEGGDPHTFKIVRAIVYEFDLGVEVGLQLLLEEWNPRCRPPWTEKDLRRKCEIADKEEFNKPRGWRVSAQRHPPGGSRPSANGRTTRESKPPRNTPPPQEPTGPPTWPPPRPLEPSDQLPPFPVDCLPPSLRRWVEAEAEATQTPLDLAGTLVLAVCAAGLARKVVVSVRPDWIEPVNLFFVTALSSGNRKSAVFSHALRPVVELERELQRAAELNIAEARSHHATLEAKLKRIEKLLADPLKRDRAEALKEQRRDTLEELARHKVPSNPRLTCEDATSEELAVLIAEQGMRMFQTSAEATPFSLVQGRYGGASNFDVHLAGHAGDDKNIDRVGRSSVHLKKPALTVAVTVQPEVIRGLVDRPEMRYQGFLARFLWSLPRSLMGKRKSEPPGVPGTVQDDYEETVRKLWGLQGTVDEEGGGAPLRLYLSRAAWSLLREFLDWLEPQLAPGEDLASLADWPNKLGGAIARMAGILCVAEAIERRADPVREITDQNMRDAIRLGRDYFMPHARAVFGLMADTEPIEDARYVLKRIEELLQRGELPEDGPTVVKVRDLLTVCGRRELRNMERLQPLIDLLVDCGYLRPTGRPERDGPGRKPSPEYEVNPRAFSVEEGTPPKNCAHNPQN